jgi:hypothetical protein
MHRKGHYTSICMVGVLALHTKVMIPTIDIWFKHIMKYMV